MDENDIESPDPELPPASPQDSSYSAHTPLQDEPNYEEDEPSLNEQSFFSTRDSLDKTEDQTAYFSFSSLDPGCIKNAIPIDEEEQLDYVDDLVDEHPVLQESILSPLPINESLNFGDTKSTRDSVKNVSNEEDGELNSENDDDIEEGEVLSSSTEGEIDDASDDPTDKKYRSKEISPLNEPILLGPALPLPEFNKENETPWEKALRQAKERMRKAKELRKKEKDSGFDQKMLNQNLLDVEELDPLKQEKPTPLEKKFQIVQPIQPKDDDMLAEYYLAAAADFHRPRFLPSTLDKMDDWELNELKKGLNKKKKKSVSRSHSSSSSDSSSSDKRSLSPLQTQHLNPLNASKPEAGIEDRLSQWRTTNRLGPSGDSWKDPWERRRATKPQRHSPGIGKPGERKSGSRSSEYSTHSSSRSSSYSSSRSYSRSRSKSHSRSASSSSSYSSRSTNASSYSKKKGALKNLDKSKSNGSVHSKSRSRDTKSNANDNKHPVGSMGKGNVSPKSRQDNRNSSNIAGKSGDQISGGFSADTFNRPSVKMHLPSKPKAVLSRPLPPSKRHSHYDASEKSSSKRSRIDNSALHSELINPTIPLSSEVAQLTRESAIEMQQAQDRQSFSAASKRAPPPRVQERSSSPKLMENPEKRYVVHASKKDQSRSYSSNIPRPVDMRHKIGVESSHRNLSGSSSGQNIRDRHRDDRQESRQSTINSTDVSRRDKLKEKPPNRGQALPASNLPASNNHRNTQLSASNGPPPSSSSAPAAENKKTAVRRREELMKQLQAVEDAIAKKRAKMSASLKS